MSTPDPDAFAQAWVTDWNRHDVEAVLAHFHDDALRHYWTTALTLLPELHFEIVGVYRGGSLLVINYRNERVGLVNEVLLFDGELVCEGHATYLT
jgi:hypothetical protein